MMTTSRCILYRFVLVLSISISAVIASDSVFDYSTSKSSFWICHNSPVQVQNLTYYCDSPYTFYYGNGAHRKSSTCDYGDKVTLTMKIYVAQQLESNIYMQISAYTDSDEQLYSARGLDLCNDFVGSSCTDEGYYSFSTKVQFAYIDGEQTQFVPDWEISFSEGVEGGFDLGGVNVQCDTDQDTYFDWQKIRVNNTRIHTFTETAVQEYGILAVTCVSLMVLGIVLMSQTKDTVDYARLGNKSQLLDARERLT